LTFDEESEVETGVARTFRMFAAFVRRTGPYLLLELVMPGGTLLALLLFLYQRRNAEPSRPAVIDRMFDTMQPAFAFAAVPVSAARR
jgi:hypothetical protein